MLYENFLMFCVFQKGTVLNIGNVQIGRAFRLQGNSLGKFGTDTGTGSVVTPEYLGSALQSTLGTETLTSIKLNYCTINRDKK